MTTVTVIHSTKIAPYANCLCDRFGEWTLPLEPGFEGIAERFPTDYKTYKLLEGDPRAFQLSENCFIAVRDSQLGILVEYELDAVLAEDPEPDVEPREYGELDYNALIAEHQRDLAHLPAKWQPEAEIFLADGYGTFDGCLTACAFVPLRGDMEKGFTSPFAPNDTRQLDGLLADMENVLWGPREVREVTAQADATNDSQAPAP